MSEDMDNFLVLTGAEADEDARCDAAKNALIEKLQADLVQRDAYIRTLSESVAILREKLKGARNERA